MVNSRFKFIRESRLVEKSMLLVSASFRLLLLLVFRCSVRIIQIDWHDLLLNFVLELMSALVLLSPLLIKTVLRIVLTRSGLCQQSLRRSLINNSTLSFTHENFFAALRVLIDCLGVVLANTRCLLFKVNVDCDGFHIVKRVVLVEGQTEIALVVHSWCFDVLLGLLRVVLARSDLDLRVDCHHIGRRLEPSLFTVESLQDLLAIEMAQLFHLGLE